MSWKVFSAQSLGNKYKNDPRGCQDYALSHVDQYGGLIVVCDGAGSAYNSHHGSKAFAESMLDFFCPGGVFRTLRALSVPHLQKLIIEKFKETLKTLIQKHQHKSMSSEEQKKLFYSFNTTLLFLYHSFTDERVYLGHIGDGLILGLTENGPKVLSESRTGDGGSNITFFVPHAIADSRNLVVKILSPNEANKYKGYACFSDGVEDVFFLKKRAIRDRYQRRACAPIHPALVKIYNQVDSNENLEDILREQLISTNRTDDDCGMSILKRSDIPIDPLQNIFDEITSEVREEEKKSANSEHDKMFLALPLLHINIEIHTEVHTEIHTEIYNHP